MLRFSGLGCWFDLHAYSVVKGRLANLNGWCLRSREDEDGKKKVKCAPAAAKNRGRLSGAPLKRSRRPSQGGLGF